jgi:hypothetical protein
MCWIPVVYSIWTLVFYISFNSNTSFGYPLGLPPIQQRPSSQIRLSSTSRIWSRRPFSDKGLLSPPPNGKIVANATITFSNFWIRSIANFTTICEHRPIRDPDFISWSGSQYWDEGDHVIRLADHWTGQWGVGYIRECQWYLMEEQNIPNRNILAKCYYSDFQMLKKKSMKKRKKWSTRKH